jgi:hypothetical protein
VTVTHRKSATPDPAPDIDGDATPSGDTAAFGDDAPSGDTAAFGDAAARAPNDVASALIDAAARAPIDAAASTPRRAPKKQKPVRHPATVARSRKTARDRMRRLAARRRAEKAAREAGLSGVADPFAAAQAGGRREKQEQLSEPLSAPAAIEPQGVLGDLSPLEVAAQPAEGPARVPDEVIPPRELRTVGMLDRMGRIWDGVNWKFSASTTVNLFKPGQSGNPRGRPKRRTFSEVAHELLTKPLNRSDRMSLATVLGCKVNDLELYCDRVDAMTLITAMAVAKAKKGDLEAADRILDRLDPKPRRIDLSVNRTATAEAAIAAAADVDEATAARAYRQLTESAGDDQADGNG